ncbi:DUF86 domain-containing protein [Candidatus Micrarchaeota archaeon]|nr:DUF86 domain-containing protein [Candidatus Micrarchaeota archaeon]
MIDKEQIAVMIRDTERYLSDLEELEVSKHSDLLEKKKYYASSMVIFAILNRSIDIANEVIAGSKIQIPGSYWDSFYLLGKAKIISEKTAEKMKNLVKYRNVIAHEYY